jgi:hypothetical protein
MNRAIALMVCVALGFSVAIMMGQARRNMTLEQRVADLERRVSLIEGGLANRPPVAPAAVPVPDASSRWRGFEETTIDGTVQQIQQGTIFKTVSGNIYEVSEFVMEMEMEVRPDVTVLTDGTSYRLIITGVNKPLICRKLGDVATPGGAIIESRIDDEFDGFAPGKVFKLRNGQIWEQTAQKTAYRYKYSPAVTIWKDGTSFKMKVEDMDDAVTVTRIK